MKMLIVIIIWTIGIILGLYVGVWVCFIGGIIDVVEAARATVLIPMDVALGVAKIVFAGVAGWITFFICFIMGGVVGEIRPCR